MNILDDVVPKIMASATAQVYEETPILQAVNTQYETEAKQQGDVVFIPIDNSDMTVYDVIPGHVASNDPSTRQDTIPLVLSNWKEVAFTLTDMDLKKIMEGVIPQVVITKVRALRNEIAKTIWNEYRSSYLFLGTPGTTPFDESTDKLTIAKNAKKLLNKKLANSISTNRMMLLDTDAEANASMLPEFLSAEKAGTDITIRDGVIGRKIGFEWYFDNIEPQHPDNTLSTKVGFSIKSAPTQIVIKNELLPKMNGQIRNIVTFEAPAGATGGVIQGDVFTVDGDPNNTYVIENVAEIANGDLQLEFFPAPPQAGSDNEWVNGAAITFKAPHAVNIAMHDKAIALAMAPFTKTSDVLGEAKISQVFIDPIYGIPLRLEVYQEYKQTRWSIDALWGTKTIYRDHMIRIAG